MREQNPNPSMIVTELLFDNFFSEVTPEELCAALSTMLFEEKDHEPNLTPGLESVKSKYRELKPSWWCVFGLVQ